MLQLFVATLTLAVAIPSSTADKLPNSLDLTAIQSLPVQHDGRWPPLDTAARDVVESVTGTQSFGGQDPVLLLLAWTFAPATWQNQPLISVSSAELRGELELSPTKSIFSYTELVNHRPLIAQMMALSRIEKGRKMNPLESKVSDISSKLMLLKQAFSGESIRAIPHPNAVTGAWFAIGDDDRPEAESVVDAWDALEDAFVSDNAAAFTEASQALAAATAALPAAARPSPKQIATEIRYNRLNPFRSAWIAMAIGTILAAIAMPIRRRWFDATWVLATVVGFGILTYGLSLRWQIAGRIPASNMFESLLFLSWGASAFSILATAILRHRMVVLTSSAVGVIALMLADVLPMDHFVRPIPPVLLDTVWMSIHVPVIMVSYSVLALGAMIAHVQLVLMAAAPRRKGMHYAIDTMHYWYIQIGSLLLLAGIVTGSMWAASSWGRYWGWDPKEVWSLVALLGYLAILHVRIDHEKAWPWMYIAGTILAIALFAIVVPKLAPLTPLKVFALTGTGIAMVIFVGTHGRFATALKSVLCFWLIIMTYIGVNYVLGIGLHSYGFGTGAVVRYMFLTGGIDLALILICCIIYLLRRPPRMTSPVTSA